MTEDKNTDPFANDRPEKPDAEGEKSLQRMKATGYAGRFAIPDAKQTGIDQVVYQTVDGALHHSSLSDWDKELEKLDANTGLLKVTKGGLITDL